MLDFSTTKILDAIKRNERKSRARNLVILSVVVVLALLLSYTSVFHIRDSEEKLVVEVQSNKTLQKENKALVKHISREDSIRVIVQTFLDRKNAGTFNDLRLLLADTLTRYYQRNKVSKEKLLKQDSLYKRRFPNERYQYNPNFAISVGNDTTHTIVIVMGRYLKTRSTGIDVIEQINLNRENRIVYVRAFTP